MTAPASPACSPAPSTAGGTQSAEGPLYQRDPLRARVVAISPEQVSYDAYVLCFAARSAADNDPRCGKGPAGATTWIVDRDHTLVHAQVAPSVLYGRAGDDAPDDAVPWAESFFDGTLKSGPVDDVRASIVLDGRGRVAEVFRYAPGSMR